VAVRVGPEGRGRFEADVALSSWPGIVHGGALVATLDEAARRLGARGGPRRIEARLTSSVPVETPFDLVAHADDGTVNVSILQDRQPLAAGMVTAASEVDSTLPRWTGAAEGTPLPMSEQCLACGSRNPLGLRVALSFDEVGVWVRLTPGPAWRADETTFHPALAPVLMDEVAWWLGALVMKEGGLTNRIALTLSETWRQGGVSEVVAAGRFADVTPVDRKRTFWRTQVSLATAEGHGLAAASIIFRGGPEYSRRQLNYFRPRTAPDIFRRMFPNHANSA
jgi:hypothetical protein